MLQSYRLDPTYWRNLFKAADPGLDRLHEAIWATATSGLTALILFFLALWLDQSFASASLAVAIGMNGVLLAKDPTPRARKITVALLSLPATAAMALGLLLVNHPLWLAACFVLIIVLAIFARKFGPRGYAMGLIAFSSYALSIFFRSVINILPWVTGTIIISISVAWLVRFVFFPERAGPRLFWAQQAFLARAHVILRQLIDIARTDFTLDPKHQALRFSSRYTTQYSPWRSIMHHMEHLNETMLLIEAILLESEPSESTCQHTEWLLAIETLCGQAVTTMRIILASSPDSQKRHALIEALSAITPPFAPTTNDTTDPIQALRSVANAQPDDRQIQRLTIILGSLHHVFHTIPEEEKLRQKTTQPAPPDVPDRYVSKNLPPKKITRWYQCPHFQTAIQAGLAATLAALAGYWLAPTKWHWAVMATFVIFIRTRSRGATLVKGWHRFLGTIWGVAVGLVIATLVDDKQSVGLIGLFASIFFGYYFLRISYVWLITFLTAEIALLYTILGQHAPELLYIRVVETVLGVTIGMLIAAFILPKKTRPNINAQIEIVLRELARFYQDIADRSQNNAPVYANYHQALELSHAFQELQIMASPLESYIAPSGFISIKYRITLISVLVYYARTLTILASYADYEPEIRKLVLQTATQLTTNLESLADTVFKPQHLPQLHANVGLISTLNSEITQHRKRARHDQPGYSSLIATRTVAILRTLSSNQDVIYQLADEISRPNTPAQQP